VLGTNEDDHVYFQKGLDAGRQSLESLSIGLKVSRLALRQMRM
jgi:hypothetical protein